MKDKMRTQLKLSSWAIIKSFLTIFLTASVITSAIAAFFYYGQIKDNRIIIETSENHNVELQIKGIESLLNSSASDLMFLSEIIEFIRILGREEVHDWSDLSSKFLLFSDRKGLYDQIRYLDNNGMEVVRVNYNNGKPVVVPENQLQSKADRYYFKETLPLERGQVFISPFDLNIELGKIEEPLKPIIRLGTPVFNGQGQKRGIIIFNYLCINLIRNFKSVSIHALDQVMLLNPVGYYLIASKPENEWGFMYEERKDRTFGNAYPDAWQQISIHESGQFYNTNGMFTFKTVYPLGKGWGLKSTDYYWKIVSYISTSVLKAKSHSGLGGFFMVYMGIIMLIAIASWFITSPMISGTIQTRKLAVGHFIALFLIALVSIASYTIIRVNITKQASDALVVNLSGRQRMLSQKLTKELLMAIQARSPEMKKQHIRELEENEATWTRVHIGLQKGDDELNLPGKNSEQVVKLFSIINPYYQRIKQAVDKILQLDSIDLTQLSSDSPLVQEVVGGSVLFLGVMDAIVFQYDREAGDRVVSLQRLETVIVIVVLLLLVFVGHFIFRPMVKQVRESYEALRKSEENFRSIFQFVPESLLSVNSQVEVLNFNKAFGILIGKYAPKLKISEAELEQGIISKLKEYFGERKHGIIEISKPHVNKNERLILEFDFAGKLFEEEEEEEEVIVISLKDITDHKRADEQIKASLKEKEVLLKEIHHRVKNNLQIISSLLDLQSEYIKDEQVLEIFNETQNRIESMALIHEILYQSKDLARIDFAEYIQNLTDSLFSSYAIDFDASKLKIDIQDVLLSPNMAIPCGLIINELVSNSLKHAFPARLASVGQVSSQSGLSDKQDTKDRSATEGKAEGKESEIQITFYSDNYNRKELETAGSMTSLDKSLTIKGGLNYTLIVSDNGVGFPKEMDFRNTKSLGLQLVNTLTDQLDGTIELNSNNGTEFKIVFTTLEKEEFVQNEEERENE